VYCCKHEGQPTRKGTLQEAGSADDVSYPIPSIVSDIGFMLAVFDGSCYRFFMRRTSSESNDA
jgi:hypothetical protein